MVYCGRPSKGCASCRKRKIKCDQVRPECSQCIRSKQCCPGYRDPMALMFRNESDAVVRKAHLIKDDKTHTKEGRRRTASRSRDSVEPASAIEEMSPASSMELVRYDSPALEEPPFLIPSLLPSLSVQDLATCYFFHNFVEEDPDQAKGHMDYLPMMTRTSSNQALTSAIASVGMAALSNVQRLPDAMVAARQSYAIAVRLTNAALQDPVQSKEDDMLMTVILLGMFETITCRAPHSMQAWTNHVEGAAALLKLRGPEQFQRRTGLSMFFQLRSQVLISAIQRELYTPEPIFEWSKKYIEDMETPDERLSGQLTETIIEYTNLRASIRARVVTDSVAIVKSLMKIDAELVAWGLALPPAWNYTTKACEPDPNIFENFYQTFPSIWIATMWTNYRAVRMLVNELLLIHLHSIAVSSTPYPRTELSVQCYQARVTLDQLCSDISASVPYHLGTITESKLASSRRSLGGYLIMWTLFVCGSSTWTSDTQRLWVISQLEIVGYQMGIQQAIPLADLMRTKANLLEWSTGNVDGGLDECIGNFGLTVDGESMRNGLASVFLSLGPSRSGTVCPH